MSTLLITDGVDHASAFIGATTLSTSTPSPTDFDLASSHPGQPVPPSSTAGFDLASSHPGQPVPSSMATGLASWPEDAVASGGSTSDGDGGGKELWLLALIPAFILCLVLGYFVMSKLRARRRNQKARAGVAGAGGASAVRSGTDVDVETGLPGISTVKEVKGDDRRDDDERTLVGKDEIFVKVKGR